MMTRYRVAGLPVAASMLAITGTAIPIPAFAQGRQLSLPAMPLAEALQKIAVEWGSSLNVDPDAVADRTSNPVVKARSARDAVKQATRGVGVAVQVGDDGRIAVLNEIVVLAQRDEAETSVMVRGSTTSSRLGQSLREQARNTQVISSKLIEEQQTRTISEALANAGGVTVNTATVQGGTSFSVRGFAANGSVNGLPSTSTNDFAAGTNQPIGNIERIEVLKGPDAILLGGDNLGGNINIVTKKPSANQRFYVTAETGSFGLIRGTIDANRALTGDQRLTARVIATGSKADRNFGGYRGNEDYLFAPSIRYKDGASDIIFSTTQGLQRFGTLPYTILSLVTGKPLDFPRGKRLIGGRDQGFRIVTSQFNADITHKVSDWLTLAVRGQHQESSFSLSQYSPVTGANANGNIFLSTLGSDQRSNVDAIDTFARVNFHTGVFEHKIVAGYTFVDTRVDTTNAQDGGFPPYNLLTPSVTPLIPLASSYIPSVATRSRQHGYYGQYLLSFSNFHLLAGARQTDLTVRTIVAPAFGASDVTEKATPLSPNYGVVVDLTNSLSLFGTLAYGYVPNFVLGVDRRKLPDRTTRNSEIGVKWDLFNKRMLVNASYFKIREINGTEILPRVPGAPRNLRFYRSVPGRIGKGFDFNLSGEPIPGMSLVAAFTRTNYDLIEVTAANKVVNNVPRDVYNFYASYHHRISDGVKAGIGAGINGQSSSYVDRLGVYEIGPSVQANLNGFLEVGPLDINLSIRNLFDRENYANTNTESYVPLGEPRSVRLTVGYKFW